MKAVLLSMLLMLRLFSYAQTDSSSPGKLRALPSPLASPPFPGGDYVGGPVIGLPADAPDYALQKALGLAGNKARIKIYGWVAPSFNWSSSKHFNIPTSYDIRPNHLELDQAVIRIERQPNTVQTDHVDWGFRLSNVYGLDYRYTVAKGWFSDQYFKHNNLYGYDPVEAYGMLYLPKIAQGVLIKVGRFISPPDIEAQLAPDNYLFSHSVMFSYDPFTLTGVQAKVKLSNQWQMDIGAHGGNDMAPWTKGSHLNGQLFFRWAALNGNNSVYFGINSLGASQTYNDNHDDLQMVAATWGHKFSSHIHMMTEAYYIWEKDAALGGSASSGPVQYGAGGGHGPIIPGTSSALGIVNYFQILVSSKNTNYISIRNDFMDDYKGWRTGFKTAYLSHTIGFVQYITPWMFIRPEVRYDWNTDSELKAYDGGTQKNQWSLASDIIVRF